MPFHRIRVTVGAGILLAGCGVALAAPASANQDCGTLPANKALGVANETTMSCSQAIGLLTNYLNLPQIKNGPARSATMGAWACSARGAQETSEDNIAIHCEGPGGNIDAYVNGE